MPEQNELMLGIDLGGTSMLAVAVDREGNVVARRKRSTKAVKGPEKVTERIAKTVRQLLEDLDEGAESVRGICIGAPGAVDPEKGVVHHAPNLDWSHVTLAGDLEAMLGLPVTLDNDVNVGVVGEHCSGAAKGARNVVAVFVGTGIGGGVILNGELYHGSRGSAGEIGHLKLLAGGPVCGCGRRGCVEALASRTAMERDVLSAARYGRDTVVSEIMERDRRPHMTSSVIEEALERKDEVMAEVFRRAQWYLGLLTASLVNTLDPDCIVFGGGIAERLGERFLDPIRVTAREHFLRTENAEKVRIVPTQLLEEAGALGAGILAWKRFRKHQVVTGA